MLLDRCLRPSVDPILPRFAADLDWLKSLGHNWLYTNLIGSDDASTIVSTLAGYQTDYISIGRVVANTLNFTIEDGNPLRVGDVLKEVAESGDEDGNMWSIGVYAERKLNYSNVLRELSYHLRGGRLLSISGDDIEPWRAQPGWAMVDDMPIGPGPLSGNDYDDRRWRYLEDVEMMPPDGAHTEH